MFWVALAGPMSNVFLAVVAAGLMWVAKMTLITNEYFNVIIQFLDIFMGINLFLAVFNAIPLHPLDGGKIIARFLPAEINYKLEQNEHLTSMVLMILIFIGAMKFLSIPAMFLHHLLRSMALG